MAFPAKRADSNPIHHSTPPTRGFGVSVNDAIERRAYPHHARDTVGQVPVPRYTMQPQFSQQNESFKGFGIDYQSNRRRAMGSQVPLGNDAPDANWKALPVRPKGVDLAGQGIDKNNFAFGLVSSRSQARVGDCLGAMDVTHRDAPPPGSKIVPMCRIAHVSQPPGTPRRAAAHADPSAGLTTAIGATVSELMKPTEAESKSARPCVEELSPPRPDSAALPPAGRRTVENATASIPGRSILSHDPLSSRQSALMKQRKSSPELRVVLSRCNGLFDNVLRDEKAFRAAWAQAERACPSLRACEKGTVTVEAFRNAIEALKL